MRIKPPGRKPHPQAHLRTQIEYSGEVRTVPFIKKIILNIPAPIVETLKQDAAAHGYSTMSAFLRSVIMASPLVSVADAADFYPIVWPSDRTMVAGAKPRRQLIT